MNYKYDVFVSYSHKDAIWVRNTLLPKLEAHGFNTVIDYRDFSAGSFSIEEMQRCVVESKRTVAVLTPDYVQSEWVKFETAMVQVLDPGATDRKLVPVLRIKCDIPLRLRILHYRDLRSEDEQQWELLVRDLM